MFGSGSDDYWEVLWVTSDVDIKGKCRGIIAEVFPASQVLSCPNHLGMALHPGCVSLFGTRLHGGLVQ